MPDRLGAAVTIGELYAPEEAGRIISQYRDLRNSEAMLRDLAGFCYAASAVDEGVVSLERAEGRREVFWRIMSLIESDPLRVAQFLEGVNLD